ncbi:hypothetical protein ACFYUR_19070 [Micromonospora haikouensis]|uniref:hypothetical protein n=1 Tax=Micromonospora haikouensis TaxID=686309 RepID=UPI003676EB84
MASFARAHREWENARREADTIGTRAARDEAEKLRQQLGAHPSVAAARKAVKGRLGKAGR